MFDIFSSKYTDTLPEHITALGHIDLKDFTGNSDKKNQLSSKKAANKPSHHNNFEKNLQKNFENISKDHSEIQHENSRENSLNSQKNRKKSFYEVKSLPPNKQLINSVIKTPSTAIVNTVCTSLDDITAALDTHTDTITLLSQIRLTRGMIGKMKEKKIFLVLPVRSKSFLNNFTRLIDINGTGLICMATFAETRQETLTKNNFECILNGFGLKARKKTKILDNWRNVIYRRMRREGGHGLVDRPFIRDYIDNVEL